MVPKSPVAGRPVAATTLFSQFSHQPFGALLRDIAFKRIRGGGKTFLKMQGGWEGLRDNYVMREGGDIEKNKIGGGCV